MGKGLAIIAGTGFLVTSLCSELKELMVGYFPKGYETSWRNKDRLKDVAGIYSGRVIVLKNKAIAGINDGGYETHPVDYGTEGRRNIPEDFYRRDDLQRVCFETDVAPKNGVLSNDEVNAEQARVFARFAKPKGENSW